MPVIDIKNTDTAKKVLKVVEDLEIGNEGKTEVESLMFNTDTGWIDGKLKIKARHKWGSVNVPAPTPLNPFAVREVDIAADKTFPCNFRYNVQQNEIKGDVKIASFDLEVEVLGQKYEKTLAELKIDLKRVKRILEGDLVALLEMVAGPIGQVITTDHSNEYNLIKEGFETKYGPGNYYFASKEFVDWASPERLGEWFVQWFITGGVALTAAMQQVKTKALAEANQAVNWLQTKVNQEASGIVNKILTGQQVEWPNIALKVAWQTVKYESRRLVAGNPITPWIPVRHGAFVLVWSSGVIESPVQPTIPNTGPDNSNGDGNSGSNGNSGNGGPAVGTLNNPDTGEATTGGNQPGVDPGEPIGWNG